MCLSLGTLRTVKMFLLLLWVELAPGWAWQPSHVSPSSSWGTLKCFWARWGRYSSSVYVCPEVPSRLDVVSAGRHPGGILIRRLDHLIWLLFTTKNSPQGWAKPPCTKKHAATQICCLIFLTKALDHQRGMELKWKSQSNSWITSEHLWCP